MPSFRVGDGKVGVPGYRPGARLPLRTVRGAHNFVISGLTVDSGGAALGSCTVKLFRSGDSSFVAQTISDGSGNYSFTMGDNAGTFYVVAYKPGAPDVEGTTVNTLVAV